MEIFKLFGTITLEGVQSVKEGLNVLEKSFKENSKGLKVLGGAMASVGASITAVAGLAIKKAAEIEGTKKAFQNMAAAAGQSADEIIAAMRKASVGTISEADMIMAASRSMTMGVATDTQEFTNLMEIARDRATSMGMSTAEAFDQITNGIGNLSPRALKQLGMIIDLNAAYEVHAKSLGKSTEKLTEAEKKQALYNAVLEKNSDILGSSEDSAMTAAEAMAAFKASTDDLLAALGETFLPIVKELAERITTVVRNVKDWMDKNPALANTIVKVAGGMGALLLVTGGVVAALPLMANGIRMVGLAIKTAMGPIGWIILAIDLIIAGVMLVIANWEKITGWFKGLFGMKDEAKETAESIDNLNQKIKEESEAIEAATDAAKRLADAHAYGKTEAGRYGLTLEDVINYLLELGKTETEISKLIEENSADVNRIISAVGTTAETVARSLGMYTDIMEEALENTIEQFKKLIEDFEYGETAAGRYGLKIDDVRKYLLAQGYTLEELTDLWQKYGDDTNAVLNSLGRTAREVAASIAMTPEKMLSNLEKYTKEAQSAAQNRYKAEKSILDALSKEYQAWHSDRIKEIDAELTARIRAIDEELAATVDGYLAKIKALDDEQKSDDRARKDAEDQAKLASLREQMGRERDLDKMVSLQEQYNKTKQDMDERHRKEAREDEKAALREQIDDARSAAQQRTEDLKAQAEEEKDILKDKLDETLKGFEAIDTANKAVLDAELERYDAMLAGFVDFLGDKLRATEDYIREYNRLMGTMGQEQIDDHTQRYRDDWHKAEQMGLVAPLKPILLSTASAPKTAEERVMDMAANLHGATASSPGGGTPYEINNGDYSVTVNFNGANIRSAQDINDLAEQIGKILERQYQQVKRQKGL